MNAAPSSATGSSRRKKRRTCIIGKARHDDFAHPARGGTRRRPDRLRHPRNEVACCRCTGAGRGTGGGIDRWWTQFSDPQLTALIEEALASNLDLGIAVLRIEEARANLRIVRSSLYPAVEAYAGADRSRRSNATEPTFPGPLTSNFYAAGLQASYEVDLFGRVRAGANAAQSTLLATRYNTETVRTVLAAQVATTYFTLLALDAELQISRDTLVSRDESVSLQRLRYDAGLISEFDLRLARPTAPAWRLRCRRLNDRARRRKRRWRRSPDAARAPCSRQ